MDVEHCIVYVHNPSSNLLVTKAICGSGLDRFTVSVERGLVGLSFTSCRGILSTSPYSDPRFDQSLDQNRNCITRNIICAPIHSGNECIGCIEVTNKKYAELDKGDFKLVTAVAKELAMGLIQRRSKATIQGLMDNVNEFKEKTGIIANENLLTPMLKYSLTILAEFLKSEK